jgi:hypothetical protein
MLKIFLSDNNVIVLSYSNNEIREHFHALQPKLLTNNINNNNNNSNNNNSNYNNSNVNIDLSEYLGENNSSSIEIESNNNNNNDYSNILYNVYIFF